MIHLRKFCEQDLDQLYKLDRACFAPDIAYSQDVLSYLLENPRCFSLVAEGSEEMLAGFIIVERARRRGTLIGHIVTIDVDSVMRRQGVGLLLIKAAERQLKSERAIKLVLEVAEDNKGAQEFYRRFGFIETGRIPNYYAGRLAALVMEKKLSH